jgi:DUF4097 and DUF4098 domain-containing protein YvlB
VVVDGHNGEIEVVTADVATITVERDETYTFRRPRRSASVEDGTLELDDGCPRFTFFVLGRCEVDFRITIPSGLEIDLETSNGDIVVQGVSGPINADTSNGSIELDGVSGEVSADTSNGSIIGRGLLSTVVDVDTSNGRIVLVFDAAPERVVAETSNGSIEIQVPEGPYRVDANTDNGDLDLNLAVDPDAERSITAESSNGDIDILRR